MASTASPTRTRKSAARKTTVRKPAAEPRPKVVEADFEPIDLTTEADTAEEVMVRLFSIDGTPYYVPGTPDVGLAFKYLRVVRSQGQEMAVLWLLETALSEQAFDALVSKRFKPEAWAKVAAALQTILLGGMEAPKV
jgi:hypothetical protein